MELLSNKSCGRASIAAKALGALAALVVPAEYYVSGSQFFELFSI